MFIHIKNIKIRIKGIYDISIISLCHRPSLFSIVLLNFSFSPIIKKTNKIIDIIKQIIEIIPNKVLLFIRLIPINKEDTGNIVNPIVEVNSWIFEDIEISSFFSLSGKNPEIVSQNSA